MFFLEAATDVFKKFCVVVGNRERPFKWSYIVTRCVGGIPSELFDGFQFLVHGQDWMAWWCLL